MLPGRGVAAAAGLPISGRQRSADDLDGEGVHPILKFLIERLHHRAMTREPAHGGKPGGGDADPEVGLAAGAPASVTSMFFAFVDHFKVGGSKFDGKFFDNEGTNGHMDTGSGSGADASAQLGQMKLDSKYFDRIRVRPRHEEAAPKPQVPCCGWEGCELPGLYRAPKGNRASGEYHNFCLEHVRHYNQVFNFFAGMSVDEMEAYLKREQDTDGRPSWGIGGKPEAGGPQMPRGFTNANGRRNADPLHVFARYRRYQQRGPQPERARPVNELDRRALEVLGFGGYAKAADIKVAYKRLVKIHHPDANGGDKGSEERLRRIIAAYTHLKTKGFVKA
jgi:hypothetical protein